MMVRTLPAHTRRIDAPTPPAPRFHHVGVQTVDLANSLAWYEDFFGATATWTLTTFSETTVRRLPGITTLTEVVAGPVRIHLFERAGRAAPEPGESVIGVQHVCFAVGSPAELAGWRARWLASYESGRYSFAFTDPPTEVDVDADGVCSFYAYDVNGLEFEFTHVPGGAS